MKNFGKLFELTSILPVTIITCILALTPIVTLTGLEVGVFLSCAVLLIIGIALFNIGADEAMSTMGNYIATGITKTKKTWLIVVIFVSMGLLITIAEPDLSVLAQQVSKVVNNVVLMVSIGAGVGVFLVIGVLRIIFKKDLNTILMFAYFLAFAFTAILVQSGKANFIALAFDSGGVTTGPLTVPFIMALGLGIASTIGGKNAKDNSFGVVSLCSIGPIVAVVILGMFLNTNGLSGSDMFDLNSYVMSTQIFAHFGHVILSQIRSVSIAMGMIVGFFLVINFIFLKLPKSELKKIFIGLIMTFFGLIIFLSAAETGFLPIGFKIGKDLANFGATQNTYIILIIFAFVIGFVVVLAEPAVKLLTRQVEDVTTGGISKMSMLIALCIGVGLSIGLSMIRIVYNFSVLYYLVPGYIISLLLSFFVPKMYTAIAFDSGGVASGPLTSSFILPFAIGACSIIQPNALLEDAFGIVAMVAMTPLITIQLLGFKSVFTQRRAYKSRMRQILTSDDEQIINF